VSIRHAQDSQGNFQPPDTVLGEWTLSNGSGQAITGLEINALVGNVIFDGNLTDPAIDVLTVEYTPESGFGRNFTPDPTSGPAPASAAYGDLFSAPDLWGSLTLSWAPEARFTDGSRFQFLADTDRTIPVPGTLLLLLIGSFGLMLHQRVGGR